MKLLSFSALLVRALVVALAGSAAAFGGDASDAPTPETLTYYAEDHAPANYLQNGQVTGLTVESLRLMWKNMGVAEQPISVVPWARGYRETLRTPGSVLFTMSRTPEREKQFKWVGPVFVAYHVLIAKGEFDKPVTSLIDASQMSIAVVRDDVTYAHLLESKHPQAKTRVVTTSKQLLEMLNRGRVDLIITSLSGFLEEAKKGQYTHDDFRVVARVSTLGNYIAFHKDTPDALIERFQSALDQTRDQRQALYKKYNVSDSAYALQ